MTTEEWMRICREMHLILKTFPGMEPTSAIAHIKQAVAEYRERHQENALQPQLATTPPLAIDLQKLAAMSSMELIHHLQTAKQFKLKKDLQSLAKLLGMSYTQKQTKDALLHMIIKRFELQRMDAKMQEEHTDDKKTSQPTG